MREIQKTALAVFALTSLLACSISTPIGPINASSSAPDLGYMPAEKVRTAMWVLAAEIEQLERLLEDPAENEPELMQAAIAGTLKRMRVAAKTLDQPGKISQHPVINQNLGRFLERLDQARRAVDRDPPNYFLASTIGGSCFVCHGRTSGTVFRPSGRAAKKG